MYYYRARYYDPAIGRFISQDPQWATNLYSYVANDPVNFLDPMGMWLVDFLNELFPGFGDSLEYGLENMFENAYDKAFEAGDLPSMIFLSEKIGNPMYAKIQIREKIRADIEWMQSSLRNQKSAWDKVYCSVSNTWSKTKSWWKKYGPIPSPLSNTEYAAVGVAGAWTAYGGAAVAIEGFTLAGTATGAIVAGAGIFTAGVGIVLVFAGAAVVVYAYDKVYLGYGDRYLKSRDVTY